MSAEHYVRELRWAHRAEQLGEALYRTAAGLSLDARRQTVWRTLARLETQTGARLASALHEEGAPSPSAPMSRLAGAVVGVALAVLPWRWAMRALDKSARPYLERLERLRESTPGGDVALLDYLVEHERAQLELVEHELADRPARSLEAVQALLDP